MSLVLHQEKPLYFRVLVEFMNFMHPGENFNKATVFTQAQLLAIQPDDVKQWMCQKVLLWNARSDTRRLPYTRKIKQS